MFTRSSSRTLDQMSASDLYQYLKQNIENDDAIHIVENEIRNNEELEKRLAVELKQTNITLQRSVEIAQQRKQILSYIERLKQVFDLLNDSKTRPVIALHDVPRSGEQVPTTDVSEQNSVQNVPDQPAKIMLPEQKRSRDNAMDSWTYLSLSKQCSPKQARQNKTTYFGFKFLSGILGSIGSIGFWVLFMWLFIELIEICDTFLSDAILNTIMTVVSLGAMFGVVRTALWGYDMLLGRFTRSFLQHELRPFFVIKEESEDPYIGRIFLDKKKRVTTVCSLYQITYNNIHYYNTYYVKNGIQYKGEVYSETTLKEFSVLQENSL